VRLLVGNLNIPISALSIAIAFARLGLGRPDLRTAARQPRARLNPTEALRWE